MTDVIDIDKNMQYLQKIRVSLWLLW